MKSVATRFFNVYLMQEYHNVNEQVPLKSNGLAVYCMCLLVQGINSLTVCVSVCAVGATCTFRPACQARTIFSSVTGQSPAPSSGSDAGSLASSASPCLPCLPPVPGCRPPWLARRHGKSAFDGPEGTGGGDGRACGEDESPWRSSMH